MPQVIFKNRKTNPELQRLLEAAKDHKMTPAEVWDQRVSFVYGQLMDCAPDVTREQIIEQATKLYGPRPEEAAE